MHYNIIYKDDNAYKIIREIPIHNFQVLGMYVHELDCDRVFRENNHFLICKKIAEGTIIQ